MRLVSNQEFDEAVRLMQWCCGRIVPEDWRDDDKIRRIKNILRKWKSRK